MKSFFLAGLMAISYCAIAQENDPSLDCLNDLLLQSQIAPLGKRLNLDPNAVPSLKMLTDEKKLTNPEIALLGIYADGRAACLKKGADFRQQHYPVEINSIAQAAESKAVQLLADLYAKRITIAEANRQAQALREDTRQKITATVDRIKAERVAQEHAMQQQAGILQAQREAQQREIDAANDRQQRAIAAQQEANAQAADQARRQAAMGMILQNMNRPPLPIYQMPVRPTINTNCYQSGNQTYCTSQ